MNTQQQEGLKLLVIIFCAFLFICWAKRKERERLEKDIENYHKQIDILNKMEQLADTIPNGKLNQINKRKLNLISIQLRKNFEKSNVPNRYEYIRRGDYDIY